MIDARAEVVFGSFVSSFIVRVVSQPQNMKIDSETPAAMTEKSPAESGLNQSKLTGVASNAVPSLTPRNAMITKPPSTTIWTTTRTYWTALVASTPT